MKIYLVQDAPASMRWQASQAEAKKLARVYGGEVSPIRIAEEGREQLAEFLNGRELFVQPAEYSKPVAEGYGGTDPYQPLTQAKVNEMFEPRATRPVLARDAVCEAIASYEGTDLGYVALEVAARFKALAS